MANQTKALVDQSSIEEARQLSGEANRAQFDFTPIIEIDNSMVEEELSGGRKTKVRIEPRFIFTTKDENNEYIKTPYPTPIAGVILKARYMVDRSYKEKQTIPHFRSNEFDSFFGQNVVLRSGEETSKAMTYKEFKQAYADNCTLWSVIYFLINNGEENKIYKIKLKGTSRSNFWDYMNSFGKDSMTLCKTEVSFDVDDGGEVPFNFACFKKLDDEINTQEILATSRELTDTLNSFNTPEPTVAVEASTVPISEVVKEPTVVEESAPTAEQPSMIEKAIGTAEVKEEEDEIKVQGIPF